MPQVHPLYVCVCVGFSDTKRGHGHRNDEAEERRSHFGMTKTDFEWIQRSKTLIQNEMSNRRGRNVNVRCLANFNEIISQ